MLQLCVCVGLNVRGNIRSSLAVVLVRPRLPFQVQILKHPVFCAAPSFYPFPAPAVGPTSKLVYYVPAFPMAYLGKDFYVIQGPWSIEVRISAAANKILGSIGDVVAAWPKILHVKHQTLILIRKDARARTDCLTRKRSLQQPPPCLSPSLRSSTIRSSRASPAPPPTAPPSSSRSRRCSHHSWSVRTDPTMGCRTGGSSRPRPAGSSAKSEQQCGRKPHSALICRGSTYVCSINWS